MISNNIRSSNAIMNGLANLGGTGYTPVPEFWSGMSNSVAQVTGG
jgi:hypothetical protein